MTLKGFDQPWRLWEVPWEPLVAADRVAGPSDRTPYVGRERERERLRTLVRQARDGAGALVLIGGEAGVGKTRLADELADEARRLVSNRRPNRVRSLSQTPRARYSGRALA